MEDEQIKSHEFCRRIDPSVAKPYTRQRLVISFTLRPLYPPEKTHVTQCIKRFMFQYLTGGSWEMIIIFSFWPASNPGSSIIQPAVLVTILTVLHLQHPFVITLSSIDEVLIAVWLRTPSIWDVFMRHCVSDNSTERQKIVIRQTASHAKRTESTMTPLPTVTITIKKLSVWHQHLTSTAFKLRTFLSEYFI